MSRSAKLLLIVLIVLVPVLLYGIAKGALYYKAKTTVDDFVLAAANHADIRYVDIDTDLRGIVTVNQITVQPSGYQDTIGIHSVRVSSDDPMFFLRGGPSDGENRSPPPQLGFEVAGIKVPLHSDLINAGLAGDAGAAPTDAADAPEAIGACANGLNIDPAMLQQMGFAELTMDLGGRYRVEQTTREMSLAFDLDMHDIESVHANARLTDVDMQTFAAGGAPQFNLGDLTFAMRVNPAFGRQALKTCAIGTEQPVQEWSERLADQALVQLEAQGMTLGHGLSSALRRFYAEWGEFRLEARPAKPVGLMSLLFVPPEQLVSILGLRMSLNDRPIDDIGFEWKRPGGQGLNALLEPTPQGESDGPRRPPSRVLMRREFIEVPVNAIGSYIDREVKIKPRGEPLREGVLKRISDGDAEVEQLLHGGRFTVFVPLREIESVAVLELRQIEPGGG